MQTELTNNSEYPFFIASVEIVNDFSDNISLTLNWPNSMNDGKVNPHNRDFLENSSQLVADFDVNDPILGLPKELRTDNKTNIEEQKLFTL